MLTKQYLVEATGDVRLGIFSQPVEEVNYRDYRLTDPFGRRAGKLKRYLGFNQFQFLGILSEELVFGCAIANLKYIGTAFLYLYQPHSRRLRQLDFRAPLAIGTRFDQRPEDGTASFKNRSARIMMTASKQPRRRQLMASLACGVSTDLAFDEEQPSVQPMIICTRAGATGWVFARKTAGFKVSGTISWEGETYDLGAVQAYGHNDWSAGYMRRRTFWNWGCLAGQTSDGRIIGMNVSCGVNETSFTENCFWLDGRLHKLDTVCFRYDRDNLESPWQLTSFDGHLKLDFHPEGKHQERINAWILASNFNQLFGRYHGWLETARGERINIDGMLGYVESHYAKW